MMSAAGPDSDPSDKPGYMKGKDSNSAALTTASNKNGQTKAEKRKIDVR